MDGVCALSFFLCQILWLTVYNPLHWGCRSLFVRRNANTNTISKSDETKMTYIFPTTYTFTLWAQRSGVCLYPNIIVVPFKYWKVFGFRCVCVEQFSYFPKDSKTCKTHFCVWTGNLLCLAFDSFLFFPLTQLHFFSSANGWVKMYSRKVFEAKASQSRVFKFIFWSSLVRDVGCGNSLQALHLANTFRWLENSFNAQILIDDNNFSKKNDCTWQMAFYGEMNGK